MKSMILFAFVFAGMAAHAGKPNVQPKPDVLSQAEAQPCYLALGLAYSITTTQADIDNKVNCAALKQAADVENFAGICKWTLVPEEHQLITKAAEACGL